MFLSLTVLLVVIIVVMVMVIFWISQWKTATLGRERSLELGYGYYGQPTESGCHYTPGQDYGVKIITTPCIPNDKTKFGCLNDAGELTYDSKIQKVPCRIIPRLKYFTEQTTPCIVESQVCVAPGTTGHRQRHLICVEESGQGLNECMYVCGSRRDDLPACRGQAGKVIQFGTFPFGSTLSSPLTLPSGYTIFTKQIGGWPVTPDYQGKNLLTDAELHQLDSVLVVEENCADHDRPICGEWQTRNPITSQLEPCTAGDSYQICSGNNTNPFDIFETGWTTYDAECSREVCLPPTNCVTSLDQAESGKYLCQNGKVGCLKTCSIQVDYSRLNVHYWVSELGRLVRSFSILHTDETFLTLRNIPLQVDQTMSVGPLTDTFSDPFLPLQPTPCMLLPRQDWRRKQSSQVQLDTALYLLIKPYASTSERELVCNLRVVFGNYNGWLTVDATNQLIWQTDRPATPIFTIQYTDRYHLKTDRGVVQVPIFRSGSSELSPVQFDTYEITEDFHRHNLQRGDRQGNHQNLLLRKTTR